MLHELASNESAIALAPTFAGVGHAEPRRVLALAGLAAASVVAYPPCAGGSCSVRT